MIKNFLYKALFELTIKFSLIAWVVKKHIQNQIERPWIEILFSRYNEHNQIANSSEQESRGRKNEYFGLQLKNLSNTLKTVGQQR